MWKTRIFALVLLIAAFGLGWFVYKTENNAVNDSAKSKYAFKLGLDLKGGTTLTYRADVSKVPSGSVGQSMDSLRDVIERRVNLFGVSEPSVQVEQAGFSNGNEERLIVDLPGVSDIDKAVEMIGQTPLLEFRTEGVSDEPIPVTVGKDGTVVVPQIDINSRYKETELTGRFLKRASVEFDQNTGAPKVSLQFNEEGSKLFEDITRANVGKTVAIFLDGSPISTPRVNEAITGGQAVISGNFTPQEAKLLVGRLNSGALPVPIELISTQTIGASLGDVAVNAGIKAGIIGLLLVALFLIIWYRLPGIVAVIALLVYVIIMLSLFKIIPITLTAAGIAGFIISIGTAVDGNILIFERIKEELRGGKTIKEAIEAGYARAWFSIRDANIASIISGIVLYSVGTSLMKGFALTLVVGMIVSLTSILIISKILIFSLSTKNNSKIVRFLFSSGISK